MIKSFYLGNYSLDDQNLSDFIKKLQEILAKYPNYKDVHVQFDYDGCCNFSLFGYREETEAEKYQREKQEEAIQLLNERSDRLKYEELKKRFG